MYPIVFGTSYFLFTTYKTSADKAKKIADEASMPKASAVDPDLFNPFTAIPFHNSVELNYRYGGIKMHNYVDKNHMNLNNYVWKGYHNSFDHDNKKQYMYNWVSMTASDHKWTW